MHRGYTKRWRKRWDKNYHHDAFMWLLMDYFIDFAAYRDKEVFRKGVGNIFLKRGQWHFTTRELADYMRVNRQKIRTCLKTLKNINFLTLKTTHKYSIVSVINYDTYQTSESEDNPHINPQTNPDLTQTQPTEEFIPSSTNKGNKGNNKTTIPDWLDLEVWSEYKKYRQTGKSKFTPYAQGLAINKLKKLKEEGNDPNEVLKQTMVCGWSGLFPLNKNKNLDKETTEEWIKRVSQD